MKLIEISSLELQVGDGLNVTYRVLQVKLSLNINSHYTNYKHVANYILPPNLCNLNEAHLT